MVVRSRLGRTSLDTVSWSPPSKAVIFSRGSELCCLKLSSNTRGFLTPTWSLASVVWTSGVVLLLQELEGGCLRMVRRHKRPRTYHLLQEVGDYRRREWGRRMKRENRSRQGEGNQGDTLQAPEMNIKRCQMCWMLGSSLFCDIRRWLKR